MTLSMVAMMTKRILALTVAVLLAFCFTSCKKADKDKTEVSSADGTSSYEFILEDDLNESLTSEEEEKAQNAWNSIATDSNAIVIEPYKPESSSSKPAASSSKPAASSGQTGTSSSPASSSKPETTTPSSSSSTITPSSSSQSTPSQEEPDNNTDNTTTSSKPGWRPGIY